MILIRTLFTLCLAAGVATAQESETVDLEARRQSVATLKQHLAMREKRLAEVSAEIRERGQATDKKIGELVDMLAGLKDSQSSKRRISEVKAEAIAGLKRMLEVYKRERNSMVAQLRSESAVPAEDLKKDMATIDTLTEKRVAQILELVKSMPGGQDITKYEQDSSYEANGVYYENSRVSEEWRQNRRDRVQTEKQRKEAQDAFRKSIANLENRRDTLASQLSGGQLTEAEKELFQQELDYVTNLIEVRKSQLVSVTAPSNSAEIGASKDEADDLKQMLRDARSDIAQDFAKTVKLYHAAAAERQKIFEVKENLAAREKWLQENDPGAKKTE